MGRPAGWMRELTGRAPMKSPGRRRCGGRSSGQFWREIARGLTTEEAAVAVGVSPAVGAGGSATRGGMPIVHARAGVGPLPVVRGAGGDRDPASAGRGCAGDRPAAGPCPVDDLAGAAPQRGDAERRLEYRASIAQWKAELVARRPKTAKLVANERLREYVQERLSGEVRRPDGRPVLGPDGAEWNGRNKPHRGDRRWVQGVEPGADREPAAGRLPR